MNYTNHPSTGSAISPELHQEFKDHVLSSCVNHDFPSTYFSTGIAEECVEFLDVLNIALNANSRNLYQADKGKLDTVTYGLMISEAGDILWYLYALSLSLPGGKFSSTETKFYGKDGNPKPISFVFDSTTQANSNTKSVDAHQLYELKDQLCSAMGKLCGSVKKFSRGDKSWEIFQARIQKDIYILLQILHDILYLLPKFFNSPMITFESTMKYNIQKIALRKSEGKIKGDGENR